MRWILPIILILALVIRIVGISAHPAGFTPDEASFGYDAYSILKTGKDQWGNSYPLVLKSFGDYKLPLYSYLAIPFVALFGLNEASVRAPNAILGALSVVVTYFLVYEIFKSKKHALVAAFLLAISPWHIPLSRGAFEANLTTFFLPLGILLFLKGAKKPYLLIFSAAIFGLNMFSYHTARLLTPLVVGFLLVKCNPHGKNRFAMAFLGLFSVFVIASMYFYAVGGSRLASSSILDSVGDWAGIDRFEQVRSGEPQNYAQILNNKYVYFVRQFTKNYLSYFSPQFLFTEGPAEGTYGMVPGVGVMYLFEIVFVIAFFVKFRESRRGWGIIIFWILISPLAASVTKGSGYAANRAAFMMPALQILSAGGAVYLLDKLKNERYQFLKYVFILILIFSVISFGEKYIFKQRANQAQSMIYGAKEIIGYTSNFDSGKEIIISKSVSEPQIYAAFYQKIDPNLVQKASIDWARFEEEGRGWVDQLGLYKLGNYTFKSIDRITDLPRKNTVIVGSPGELVNTNADQKIYYPNGDEAFWILNN